MKSSILLLAFSVIVLASCTTAYKTGQTPDDVYFSPSPPQEEYVSAKKSNDDRKYSGEDYYDDRFLRMKVRNRTQWSDLNDWYNYDRYSIYYYHSNYWGTTWNPYTTWNYYYNPYCHNTVILNPKNITYNKPRTVNLNTFNTNMMTNRNTVNPKVSGNTRTNTRTFNDSNNRTNNNTGLGNTLRNIFNSSGSDNSTKSTSSGSNSSNSSSGSSGKSSSAPVRKF